MTRSLETPTPAFLGFPWAFPWLRLPNENCTFPDPIPVSHNSLWSALTTNDRLGSRQSSFSDCSVAGL